MSNGWQCPGETDGLRAGATTETGGVVLLSPITAIWDGPVSLQNRETEKTARNPNQNSTGWPIDLYMRGLYTRMQ
jgi:hypothetical protein